MPDIFYDFGAASNGTGTPDNPRNTWAAPVDDATIHIRRGNRWVRNAQITMGAARNLRLKAWAYANGEDDPHGPKPVITGSVSSSTYMNFSGEGVHKIEDIRFENILNSVNPLTAGPAAVSFGNVGTIDVGRGVSGEVHRCEFSRIGGNAVQFNGISNGGPAALAAARAVVMHSLFDDIGSDAVFAKVAGYLEVAYNRMTRLSLRDTNGDGVGLLDTNPEFAWVHHNYIDHRDVDSKQCVMIDGVDGTGFTLVEDNVLFGFGNPTTEAAVHTMLNVEGCRAIIRRNRLMNVCGLGVVANAAGTEIYSNLLDILNFRTGSHAISLLFSGGRCDNNTAIVRGGKVGPVIQTGTSTTGLKARNNLGIGSSTLLSVGNGSSVEAGGNATTAGAFYAVTGSGVVVPVGADRVVTAADYNAALVPSPGSVLVSGGLDIGPVSTLNGFQSRKHIGALDAASIQHWASIDGIGC